MKNEFKSRREFFKEAAKKALPIIGAVVMLSNPVIASVTEGETLSCNGCQDYCVEGCKTGCGGKCADHCAKSCSESCYTTCLGGCEKICKTICANNCKSENY